MYLKAICLMYSAIFLRQLEQRYYWCIPVRGWGCIRHLPQQIRISLKFISAQNKKLWFDCWLTYFFVVNLKMFGFGLLLAQDMGLACCFPEWDNAWQAGVIVQHFFILRDFCDIHSRSTVIFPMASTMLRKHPHLGVLSKNNIFEQSDCFQSSSYA